MASKTRTDAHRPSAITPAEYAYVGIEHLKLDRFDVFAPEVVHENLRAIGEHMRQTGGAWSDHQHGGNCMVCGAHCIYTAVFHHAASNTYVRTGMDCAAKLHMGRPEDFRVFQKAIDAAREHKAGLAKAEGVLRGAGLHASWMLYLVFAHQRRFAASFGLPADADWYALADYAEENDRPEAPAFRGIASVGGSMGRDEFTIVDIVGKLVNYGSLSEKQLAFLGNLEKRIADRPEWVARRAAEKAAAEDCPVGRLTVKGTVIKLERLESEYDGTTYTKVTLKADGGYVVMGTLPRGASQAEKGDRLEITATLKRSDRDPKFGFMSRPIGKVLPAELAVS